MKQPIVTVFGSSSPRPGSPEYERAFDLGRAIARQEWILCNGGYGGTMEASAAGAVVAGGHTIGVTCSAFGRTAGPNRHIRQEVPTFDLLTRLNTLVRLGRAYVILPGGTGTLLELALVWENANKSLLRNRKIVLLGDFWQPVVGCVRSANPETPEIHVASGVGDAIGALCREFSAV